MYIAMVHHFFTVSTWPTSLGKLANSVAAN